MNDSEKVKLAIVGCGAITRSAHLPVALRSPKIRVAALVDNYMKNAHSLREIYSIECAVTTNIMDVIDQVDGVIIATPNDTHYEIAETILKCGLPVLIEKPITTTYEDAIKLCKIADMKKTFISVGYRTRHYPSVIIFKKLLDEGFWGKIKHFHYEFGSKGGWSPLSGYNLDKKKAGGGVLIVSGTHFLDRMIYWFGEPERVYYEDDSHGGVEANCKVKLNFNRDFGEFTGTILLSKTIKLKNTFFMNAERYLCEVAETSAEKITIIPKNNIDLKMDLSSNSLQPPNKSKIYYQLQLEEFADNILKKGKVTVDGWSAARSVKLIEEMYRNRVQLDEPWLFYK